MAKYGRFDPRNKKRNKDKYRSDKKSYSNSDSTTRKSFTHSDLKELQRLAGKS